VRFTIFVLINLYSLFDRVGFVSYATGRVCLKASRRAHDTSLTWRPKDFMAKNNHVKISIAREIGLLEHPRWRPTPIYFPLANIESSPVWNIFCLISEVRILQITTSSDHS